MNLITGATGLLGSHIAEQLVKGGHKVRALVRRGSDTAFLDSLGVEKAVGDVTDPASIAAAMQGVDVVYHSAAKVGDWGRWSDFVNITIEGTRNMLDAAKAAGIKRFLHVSSISAYGHLDGEGLVVDESYPLGANLYKWAYYSRSKATAEAMAWEYFKRGDVPLTVVKPSWLYGPRDRSSMPRLIRAIRNRKIKLFSGGDNQFNLTYAGNEAEGCILAATTDKALGQMYNLSSDGAITQGQFINRIAKCLGVPEITRSVPYGVAKGAAFVMECVGHLTGTAKPPLLTRYGLWLMGRRCFFSPDKARRELGWQPTVNYDEGIPLSVAWCLEHVMGEKK
ncbi:MAG: NAD-dependent epimerase/dehydratase family protein [Planctomycetaceae bacterium]|nr:NAD-dependent epimerase/dehydratase family protein [Planctomycetaceae bacterium]